MIPPIEERMVRPCFSFGGRCLYLNMNIPLGEEPIFVNIERFECKIDNPDFHDRKVSDSLSSEYPCIHNLHLRELTEFITATQGNLMMPLEMCQTLFQFMLTQTSPAMVLLAAKDSLAPEDLDVDAHFWTDDQEVFQEEEGL